MLSSSMCPKHVPNMPMSKVKNVHFLKKAKLLNLKPNSLYSMESIEQHNRETEKLNSNGCKLLVKKNAMLDSLNAKERRYDNSANGINFTIRKVNHMFVFIVVVWIFFFFSKYVIQNPAFFVYDVIVFIYWLRNCPVG